MNSSRIHSLLILAILTFLIVPASATHQLQNVTITPASEAIPAGTRVNLTALIRILPPGPTTTFVEWDDLVLGTELTNPRWDVVAQVDNRLVDGNPEGDSRVKVPGYLLSYDVDKNVSVRVQLDGNVPDSQDPRTFIVLSVDEENDRGVPIGSAEYVTRAILPTSRAPTLSGTPSPIKTTAGLSLLPVIAGLGGAAVILGWRRD